MTTKAIIVAGGLGTRLKTIRPKPLVMLNGKPLLAYSADVFEKFPSVDSIIIVTHEYHVLDVEDVVRHYNFQKVERVVIGGETRSASVYNGLRETGDKTDIVVIHDGARPLINARTIQKAIEQCKVHGAAVVGVKVKSTIKRVDPLDLFVRETLNRGELWEIQTPQVFNRELLLKAYAQKGAENPTDDAGLVERLGISVKVIEGDYENIKITTNEDLVLAEAFLNARADVPYSHA